MKFKEGDIVRIKDDAYNILIERAKKYINIDMKITSFINSKAALVDCNKFYWPLNVLELAENKNFSVSDDEILNMF